MRRHHSINIMPRDVIYYMHIYTLEDTYIMFNDAVERKGKRDVIKEYRLDKMLIPTLYMMDYITRT